MKSMINTAVAVPAATPSIRTVAASMIAVAVAFGAALVVPAVSGMPTGYQATAAVSQQTDGAQHDPRQRRIVIARNNRSLNDDLMVVVQAAPTTPAM
jgi:hypothetical protein